MSDVSVNQAQTKLRGNSSGDLRFDDHLRPIKYIINPADGRLVSPVMFAMLDAIETVLCIPKDAEDGMEVLVTIEEFDEHGSHGALTDRWRIYHGEPKDTRWAFLDIDAARFENEVIDGDAMMQPNALADAEVKLCRMMNTQHADKLHAMCKQFAGVGLENPVMVGIDSEGMDVRGEFQVYRVPLIQPATDAETAQKIINEMIATVHIETKEDTTSG